jgi:hypothetical protein
MDERTGTTSPAILACRDMFKLSEEHAQMSGDRIDTFYVSKALFEEITKSPAIEIGEIGEIDGKRVLEQVMINPEYGLMVTLIEDDAAIPTGRVLEDQWSKD